MRIHTHAILTAAATLALMVMGSLVHGTGSSLACPDWPLCHGSFFPAMVNGVEFEHTHRLMAGAVVVLTIALLWRLRRGDGAHRPTRRLAIAACLLVALQSVLGGLTVLYELPQAISIAHLATSMTFLSVLVILAARLAPQLEPLPAETLAGWRGAAALLMLAQIVLGGLVRHSGAALACMGIPLCNGSLWPESWPGAIHMLHRLVGGLAFGGVVAVSVAAVRRERSAVRRAVALAPAVLGLVQVSLGVAVVLATAPLILVTLHHACGALLLASLALSWGACAAAGDRGREARGEHTLDAGLGSGHQGGASLG